METPDVRASAVEDPRTFLVSTFGGVFKEEDTLNLSLPRGGILPSGMPAMSRRTLNETCAKCFAVDDYFDFKSDHPTGQEQNLLLCDCMGAWPESLPRALHWFPGKE